MTDDRIHDATPSPKREEDLTVDDVPGPQGVDDTDQNPPLPDWGATDGTHGEG